MKRTAESGFTLLELLMVVIIIAILAALALPAYFRAVEKSRASEATLALGAMKGAIQRYCVEQQSTLPTAFTDLDVEDPNSVPNAQFAYAFPTSVTCIPVAVAGAVATRNNGPCSGSTITMNYPPAVVGASPFVYSWQGPCQ